MTLPLEKGGQGPELKIPLKKTHMQVNENILRFKKRLYSNGTPRDLTRK